MRTLPRQDKLTKKEARLAALHLKIEGAARIDGFLAKHTKRYCQRCEDFSPTIDKGAACAVCKLVLP